MNDIEGPGLALSIVRYSANCYAGNTQHEATSNQVRKLNNKYAC